jgi:hypothetical protein
MRTEDIMRLMGQGMLIPRRMNNGKETSQKTLEAAGFMVFGGSKSNKFLFRTKMPEGWTINFDPLQRGGWWYLYDRKKRHRLSMLWCPGRQATSVLIAKTRFYIAGVRDGSGKVRHLVIDRIGAEEVPAFATEWHEDRVTLILKGDKKFHVSTDNNRNVKRLQRLECKLWLMINFPLWKSARAYWNDDGDNADC